MTEKRQEQCCRDQCNLEGVALLEHQPLCLSHFISDCYDILGQAGKGSLPARWAEAGGDKQRQILDECFQQAAVICFGVDRLDNLERTRLLDIMLWASKLLRQKDSLRLGLEHWPQAIAS